VNPCRYSGMRSRSHHWRTLPRAFTPAVALIALGTPAHGQAPSFGSVVVFNDEWPLTNVGFSNAPSGAQRFTENLVDQMDPHDGVKILIWSSNYSSEWTGTFRARLVIEGATVTTSSDPSLSLSQLLQHDGVILADALPSGGAPNNARLIDYVNAGGNALVLGGCNNSDASYFNTFLNAFGLGFIGPTNWRRGTFAIPGTDPFFLGVGGLWQDNGNDIIRVGSHPGVQLYTMVSYDRALYAVSRLQLADCDGDSVPDVVEIRRVGNDANSNGVPDACECPADLDRSGAIGAEDLAAVLFAWGTSGGKTPEADINDDGTVDANDLSVVIAGWGSCPS
jgi:hypothetical protein